MHSELIELNGRLNEQIIVKDHCITKLRTELVSLRGPLPSDEIPHTNIHLWVPSAFLVGRINDPHHVYQVCVNILKYYKLKGFNLYSILMVSYLFLYVNRSMYVF